MRKLNSLIATGIASLLLQHSAVAVEDLDNDVDLDSLIPVEEIAEELGQEKNINQFHDEESLDLNQGFHHHWPWVYPVPYPYYYPVPYSYPVVTYPVGYRGVVCYASDQFGATFSTLGFYAAQVQQEAMNQCFMFSNRGCYPRGCYYQ
ncbi:MAG: hypothetical protein EBZ77_13875 [Chitinophagia bacterium]|nr:hypothetical protein [Chitinophagia bacterium]